MRAIEFITELEIKPYKSQVLNVDAAVALLNKKCKQSLAMIHAPLWRGMRNHDEPIISIDPRQSKRKSQNTTNYYTEIIDHSPYFEGWPKRSKSLICSSGQGYAHNYAHGGAGVYAIFPYDNVKIAVCPEEDMWSTPVMMSGLGIDLGENGDDMSGFNRFLRYDLGLSESYPEMIRQLKSSTFAAALENVRAELSAAQRRDVVTPENFLAYIQKNLSPQHCGFRLMTIEQYAKYPPNNKECWVGGPVVAIREDIYNALVDAVKDNAADSFHALKIPPKKAVKSPKKAAVQYDTIDARNDNTRNQSAGEVSMQDVKYYADAGMRLTPEEYEYWKRAHRGEFDVGDEEGEF